MLWFTLAALISAAPTDGSPLRVEPAFARLRGSDSSVQVLATGIIGSKTADATGECAFEVADPAVVEVSAEGLIRPKADGRTTVLVRRGAEASSLDVVVEDFANSRTVDFAAEVVPIFTKGGCNAGNCHGKASGMNGLKLSLLGFDPTMDYESLVREGRGRRVFPASPGESLLLKKATARVPHGGGRKVVPDSPEYRTIARWIAQGALAQGGKAPALTAIEVSPPIRVVDRGGRQQLRVEAKYDDGSTQDVTRLARYTSNTGELATVDERGLLRALDGVGEASVMVRFGGKVSVARALVPLGGGASTAAMPASDNLVDKHVFAKLRALGIPASEACDDGEFLRRAMLDICGILPKPAEVVGFRADTDPEKRTRLVDRLVDRPEYADLFAMKWSAILRNKRLNNNVLNQQNNAAFDPATFALHGWIRQSIAQNKPYVKFVAEILSAKGDAATNPPVVLFRPSVRQTGDEIVDDTAQLFLGLRIQCARCHHHPFERWSQDDYYGFAAFFARVGMKPSSDPRTPRVFVKAAGTARNPTSMKSYQPKSLDGPILDKLGRLDDPRQALADWMGRPDNPFFAKALVNRYWKHFFGRGLVEPEDDMRVSNPPTDPELMDALADDFIKSGYDLKRLVKLLASSRAYDRSSLPTGLNAKDRQSYARYYPRRLSAEVLLDALNEVIGTTEKFASLPKGFRATQLPDEGFNSYFLDIFGRPKRESVCECERISEANLSQRLHLLNSAEIEAKLGDGSNRITRWLADKRPEAEKLDELYRACFARVATDDERDVCLAHLRKKAEEGKARQGVEDLVWSLVNSKDFLFNR